MPSTIRRTAAAAAAAAVLTLTATACDPEGGSGADAAPAATAAPTGAKPGLDLGEALKNLKNWTKDDWANWAKAHGFTAEKLKGFWDQARMEKAQGMEAQDATLQSEKTAPENDPQPPAKIAAKPQPHPYSPASAVLGKIFMQVDAESSAVCSGTVISDPAHPGKSNLVWTAAHCLHEGKGGTWFKKMAFVPSYNRTGAASNGKKANFEQLAPYGAWTADYAVVSPQWAEEGGERGGPASQYDFGIIRVHNEDSADGRSLEEVVGSSVPVWFDAPRAQITSASAYGYPQGAPFDGRELEYCDSRVKPARLSFDAERPTMYVIGCTMTGGSSGGGWFVLRNGKPTLVSNNSIGPRPAAWMAGPALGGQAKAMFDYMSTLKK
ncbi:trypsin-like serine peptidase [Kitasatospora sp. KL5]|uniref:trypsin-like serine peptidase n=1 Tax=Kitasatospora sp. KL5 TaxID=3425125 RepID=UPI003D6FB57F